MPSKKTKRQEKQKKRGGEKAERKSKDCCVTFKPENDLQIVHAQNLKANINFCMWITRLQRVQPENGFVIS